MSYLHYDFRAKSFYYEDPEENRITIKYNTGRFSVDMSGFFPCSKHDYIIFLDMIENSNECNEHVARLQDFFSCVISMLEKYRNGEQNASRKASYNTQLKKWLALYNELSRRYNLEQKTDTEATVKCKKIICYPFCRFNNDFMPVAVDGWQFEKYGMQFYVYRNAGSKLWHVIVPFCGLAISSGEKSKQAAIASVNAELIERLKKVLVNPAKNEELQHNYIAFLKKGNVEDIIQDPLYNIPALQTEEATPEVAETTGKASVSEVTENPVKPLTINSNNYTSYAVKSNDGVITPLQYNGNEGYIYAVINGTIYSSCTYKNHADLYTLEIIPLQATTAPAAPQNRECFQTLKTCAKPACNASSVPVYQNAIRRSKNGVQRFTGHITPLIQAMQPTGYTTPSCFHASYYDSS